MHLWLSPLWSRPLVKFASLTVAWSFLLVVLAGLSYRYLSDRVEFIFIINDQLE